MIRDKKILFDNFYMLFIGIYDICSSKDGSRKM